MGQETLGKPFARQIQMFVPDTEDSATNFKRPITATFLIPDVLTVSVILSIYIISYGMHLSFRENFVPTVH